MSYSCGVLARLGAPAQTCIARVGEQMVTLVRRLFGVRAYDNRSYEINSCHIAKVLRRVSTPTAAVSLNQRPAKRDGEDEPGAPTRSSCHQSPR